MPETYIVAKGDSFPSIAKEKGFFWKTLWNHGNNAALKQKRKNPNVLFEGDEVHIPDLTPKEESRGTDAKHKFRRKGEPIKLAIRLCKADGTPRKNEAYKLIVGPKEYKGSTDGDGVLKQFIPNTAKKGILSLKDGKECFPVQIGSLDPVDEVNGVQQRLSNMGYDCQETGELDDQTVRAIENFQAFHKLKVNGEMNDELKNKLMELTQ